MFAVDVTYFNFLKFKNRYISCWRCCKVCVVISRFILHLGVGQVILQVAGSTDIKLAYGIEKAETPCIYAKAMDEEFRSYMAWYGKTYTEYMLEQGNFLEPECLERINKAE